jgi:methyltransferase family protein
MYKTDSSTKLNVAVEPTLPPADAGMYELDSATRELLLKSAPLMQEWSKSECVEKKSDNGMELWAKGNVVDRTPRSCGWYHGTWQHLRLLNMVATPPWYGFYHRSLTSILRKKPDAKVLISACADYGMLATLHAAVVAAGAKPDIVVCDICTTPLSSCRWYAERHQVKLTCICENLFTTPALVKKSFDLIVTDEFLTVLPKDHKYQAIDRWKELLKPGGTVVTTAMVGGETTPELRRHFAARGMERLEGVLPDLRLSQKDEAALRERINNFAEFHNRFMLSGEEEVRQLFSDFYLGFLASTVTPGECVNPTNSFQIIATLPVEHLAAGD